MNDRIVNNNNVLQLLRSNRECNSVEDAIKLLDNFHNHQYGQQIIIKYKDSSGRGGLVVAVGVSYPDDYVIIFKGDLGKLPKEVELDDIESNTWKKDDHDGNFEWRDLDGDGDDAKYLKFLWDVYYNTAVDENHKGDIVFNDNITFNNLHRADSTPVQSNVYTQQGDGWDGTQIQQHSIPNYDNFNVYPIPKNVKTNEFEERGGNVWATENEDWKVLCYRYQKDGEDRELSYLNMSDFIADSAGKDVSLNYKNNNGKWWWEICPTDSDLNTYFNRPESVAPSLRSILGMYNNLIEQIKENTKRITDVHNALHDYARWDSRRHTVNAYLNDGYRINDAPDWIKGDPDLTKDENDMCLFMFYNNETQNWYINDEGELVEEELENGAWTCPVDNEVPGKTTIS